MLSGKLLGCGFPELRDRWIFLFNGFPSVPLTLLPQPHFGFSRQVALLVVLPLFPDVLIELLAVADQSFNPA